MTDRSYIGKIAQRLASTVKLSTPSEQQMRGDIMALIDQKLPGNHEDQPFRRFEIDTGDGMREIRFDDFEDFCRNWLFFRVEKLQAMFSNDIPVRAALTHVLKQSRGNPTGANQYEKGIVYNVHNSTERPAGNSKDAGLRRLKNDKDNPDLYEQVLAGELSVNAAMVAAGYRPRTIQLSEKADPEQAARRIREKFGDEYAESLKQALEKLR